VSEKMTLCCSFGPSNRIGKPSFDFSAPEGDTTLAECHPKGKLASLAKAHGSHVLESVAMGFFTS
jgi:hypothetical protein